MARPIHSGISAVPASRSSWRGRCASVPAAARSVSPVLREFLLDAVLLAALGTVADVVPLFDENRIFVRHGLVRLRQKPGIGVAALLKQAKLEAKLNLGAFDIGYALAPRLNAAGRLGTARLAVELLTTTSTQRADTLADYLERQNQERQLIERRILQEARELAVREADAPALVLASPSWHPGLIGIVASRLVDQYARPVLMIALRDGQPHGQGSGRSVPGFRLHEALEECTVHLLSHGGHASAAGFRIDPAMIDGFRHHFYDVAARHFGDGTPAHRLVIDAEVPLSALTLGLLQAIDLLEPYGSGNPQPLLLADRLQVVGDAEARRRRRTAPELSRAPERQGGPRHRVRHGRSRRGADVGRRPMLPGVHAAAQRMARLSLGGDRGARFPARARRAIRITRDCLRLATAGHRDTMKNEKRTMNN